MKKTLTLYAHVEDDNLGVDSGANEFETALRPWRLPNHPSKLSDSKANKRANKYLNYQGTRLQTLIYNGEIERASKIFSKLARRSNSLQAYGIGRVAKGGYHNSSGKDLSKLITKIKKIINKGESTLISNRFYIPKSNGRGRPIGAPELCGRVKIGMGTSFLYMTLDHTISNSQFGFRPGKSLLATGKKIGRKYDDLMKVGISPTITEFDLESFFNLVSQRKINEILEKRGLPAGLRNGIAGVNSNPPRFDLKDLKEEKELTGEDLDLNILMKRGLPQGLAGSPLLSILVLDETFKKLEIDPILFADDGIIISESEEDYKKLLNGEKILLEHGIKLSDKIKPDGSKATRVIDDDLVTFVGVTGRTEDDKVILDNGEEIPRKLITDKQLLKLIGNKYEGEMGGRGEIKPGSGLQKYIFTERIPEESSKVNIGLSKIAQDIYFKDAFENRGMKSPQTGLSSEAQVDLLNLLSENSGKTSDQVSLEEKFADDVWGVNKVDQDINQGYIPEILRKMSSPLTRGKDSLMFDLNKRFNLNRKYFGEVGLFTMESYVSQLDIPLLRL